MTQKEIDALSFEVIGCAIEVHRHLGPGLLESVYEACLMEELKLRNLRAEQQVLLPVVYKGQAVNIDFRLDILVEDIIVVELKAVEKLISVFQAQLLTYLKLARKPKGLLINFHTENISKNLVSLVSEEYFKLAKE